MYNVSNEMLVAIKNNARFISAYFMYNGNRYDIRNFSIDDNIYTDDNFIGTFIGKNGNITLNVNDKLKLEDEEIEIFIGIKTALGIENITLGKYRIYEPESAVKFKVIDYRYKFNVPFDLSKVSYPTNPLKLLQLACSQAGVELITTDFLNKDLNIPSEVFFGYDATCADVVMAVAQASCSFAKITRNNKLSLRWFADADFTIDHNHQTKREVNKEYGVINSVVLAREPQNDNVYLPSTIEGERVELKIVNNPLLDIDRYTSIVPVYERMNGFKYTPFRISSQGYFILECGDMVKVQQADLSYINVPIMNHQITYNGGVSSTFETPALTKTQINYKKASYIESRLLKTELEVDKVNGEITAKIERTEQTVQQLENGVDELTTRTESVEQQITPDQITNTVSSEFYKKDETDNMYSSKEELTTEIKQLKDSINLTLKEMSGFNFLYNSSGWNATNFWYGTKNEDGTTTPAIGDIEGIKDNDTTDNTISGSAFLFGEGSMQQDVRLTPGNKYSVSCKMKKYMSACSLKIIQNDTEMILFDYDDTYTDEDWHSYAMTFECVASTVTIALASSAKSMKIADIMWNDGEIEKTWTSNNDEIYTAGVKIDKNGLEIEQSDTGTKVIIDSSEFAIIEKKTEEKVVRVNGDTTVLKKANVEDDLTVGNVKMVVRPNGIDFAVIEE